MMTTNRIRKARARFASSLAQTGMLAVVSLATAVPSSAVMPAAPAPIAPVLQSWLAENGRMRIGSEMITISPTLVGFYARRGFEPAWTNRRSVDDLVATLRDMDLEGLDPRDYHLDAIVSPSHLAPDATSEIIARDLLMTDALIEIAHDIRYGRTAPRRPAEEIVPASFPSPDGAADGSTDATADATADATVGELESALDSGSPSELVRRLEPKSEPYRRLKQALATYRSIEEAGGWPTIAPGPAPQPGAHDRRVPALRERLTMSGDLQKSWVAKSGDVYDRDLADAVRAFQSRHGLATDGSLGAKTIAAMNVPVGARIDQIRAALESARNVMHDLPERYVLVDVAAFRVMFFDRGDVVWSSRVIVGERDKETPMFRSDMRTVVLNPTWSVPDSIVKNELLPGLSKDPRYLARKQITRVGNDYVQAAGKNNALGRIKMLMPNPYNVYLHDTPSKSLFNRTTRTLSHGCVRVEHPVELAALALDSPQWSVAALNRAIAAGKTRTITLSNPVPVLVMYSSVNVHPDGVIEFRPDFYERDAEILRALRTDRTGKNAASA